MTLCAGERSSRFVNGTPHGGGQPWLRTVRIRAQLPPSGPATGQPEDFRADAGNRSSYALLILATR
jgi:hypothetical protein